MLRGWWSGVAMAAAVMGNASAQELPGEDRSIEPELQPVYTVGSFDGELWETFGNIRQVAFDGSGNLHVLDADNHRVVVVSPEGEFLREFGEEGEGPGEWRFPGSMAVMPDGTVAIADAGHRAFQIYTPDGVYDRSIPMDAGGGVVSIGTLLPTPDGSGFYDAAGGRMRIRMSNGETPSLPTGRPIKFTRMDDGGTETVYNAWKPAAAQGDPQIRTDGGAISLNLGGAGPRVFEPRLHTGVLPDGGLAVVDSVTYTVKLLTADGRERGRITRPAVRPIPVTDGVEARERQRQIDALEAGEGPQMRVVMRGEGGRDMSPSSDQIREMQRTRIDQTEFYPEIAAIRGLGVSPVGTLWVARSSVDPTEATPVDLISAEGRYLGTIASGELTIPMAFGPEGLVAYLQRDEYDVVSVEVRRLPPELR